MEKCKETLYKLLEIINIPSLATSYVREFANTKHCDEFNPEFITMREDFKERLTPTVYYRIMYYLDMRTDSHQSIKMMYDLDSYHRKEIVRTLYILENRKKIF